jgi:hypothetical protein
MTKTHLGLPAELAEDGSGSEQAPRNGYPEGPFAPVAQEVTAYELGQVNGRP